MADIDGSSDVVFGLFLLLGYQFSPRPADIGEARFWRIDCYATSFSSSAGTRTDQTSGGGGRAGSVALRGAFTFQPSQFGSAVSAPE